MDCRQVFHWWESPAALVTRFLAPTWFCPIVDLDRLLVSVTPNDEGVPRVPRCPQRSPKFLGVPFSTPSSLLEIDAIACRTIQFVGISAFHTIISDPLIGGTYMTVGALPDQTNTYTHRVKQLLNTFSNLGGTWPRYFVLKGVDYFSVATCKLNDAGKDITIKGTA